MRHSLAIGFVHGRRKEVSLLLVSTWAGLYPVVDIGIGRWGDQERLSCHVDNL